MLTDARNLVALAPDLILASGGAVTGFTNFEYGMSGKWLELVKQIMPDMTRAAVGEIERNIAEFARGTLTLRARWQVN
jgi:hypothetical protein